MTVLCIDIETYSDVDLKKSGVYAYTESPNFEILIVAFAYDDGEIYELDMYNLTLDDELEVIPKLIRDLTDPAITKSGFNVAFERTCLAKWYDQAMPPEQWVDTMVLSMMRGHPGSLDMLGQVLGEKEYMKDKEGKSLISYFSIPCRPTKKNGGRTRNLPSHDPVRWRRFVSYCGQDVRVERAARNKLLKLGIDAAEQRLWQTDQRINDRGILLDTQFIHNALDLYNEEAKRITGIMKELTGLANPNSTAQLQPWLQKHRVHITKKDKGQIKYTLGADQVEEYLAREDIDPLPRRVLKLRLSVAKASVKKYKAMLDRKASDDRIKGSFQFYGAMRTGRWAGRGVQLQNLSRMYLSESDIDFARAMIKKRDFGAMRLVFDDVPDILSQLVRTAFVSAPGKLFYVSDFSAIEARVIAWLAGETWRLDVFSGDGAIYETSAAMMFGIDDPKRIYKGGDLEHYRAYGKVAELALGYQGGEGALASMDKKGEIPAEEYAGIISKWRQASPAIVRLWKDLNNAALRAVRRKERVSMQKGIAFEYSKTFLFLHLPSGRVLSYPNARVEKKLVKPPGKEPFEADQVVYDGIGLTNKWESISTYGGKLAENVTQAVARDVLAHKLLDIETSLPEYDLVGHVHDEIITEADAVTGSLDELNEVMARPVPWADDQLVLGSAGFVSPYYIKD